MLDPKNNSTESGWKWKKFIPFFILLITVICYFPALHAGYIWDDDFYVTENITLLDLPGLKKIWFVLGSTPQYYPATFTSFWLEYRLWEINPLGNHAVNIIIHLLNAILIGRLFIKLSISGAWLAAILFAIHPVHVESVAWITERKNVLSTFFYLLSFYTYMQFIGIGTNNSSSQVNRTAITKQYLLSFIFFIFALGSKTVTCTLPATLLLIIWWNRGQITRNDFWPILPFFLAAFSMAWLTSWFEQQFVGALGKEWDFSIIERFLIAGHALWFYIGKLLWPHPLIFTYPRWIINTNELTQFFFPFSYLVFLSVLWTKRHRIGRGPITALLFFSGTLVPALGFVNFYPMRFSFVADHFQYLASIGLIGLAASGIMQWIAQKPAITILASILLMSYGVLTWNQTHVYKNAETLWRDTISKNPEAWMAHNNLAGILKQKGRAAEAKAHFKKAIRIKPDSDEPYNNLGLTLKDENKFDEALGQFQQLLKNNPYHSEGLNNMGLIFMSLGKMDQAKKYFLTAIRYNPGYFNAHNNLGLIFTRTGNWDQAMRHYQIAKKLNPSMPEPYHNIGLILAQRGKWAQAKHHLQQALALKPDFWAAKKDLDNVIAIQKKEQ